ncbi:MAG TPA: tripartite tricarboxylate transporter substrate binding protein [Burkholderiales bacterium]|nr:tripartite tricarboxylate transporter substrate binding protein [Burkholderiales bacterium]
MRLQGNVSTRVIASAALLAASGALHAQYPSKPISLVVPFSAGSDADLAGRNLSEHASKYLDQTVVVVNQPGASGAIGTMTVRNAPADGYMLLLARIASQVILPAMDAKTPYRWSDFTLLSVLEVNPYVCAVKADAPYKSMKDLIESIATHPGKLNFATVGAGTIQSFGPQYLFSILGLPKDAAVGVPYKGSGDLTAALLGGHVQFACSNLGALLPHFKSGALRALMTTTRERLPELPEAPTARALGWPAMERLAAWSALAGPPRLPKEVVQRWTGVLAKLARDPDWVARNEKLGGIPAIRSPAETEEFVREQYELYERLALRAGLRSQ